MRKGNKCKSISSMKTPRLYFGATAIGEKLYVVGGCFTMSDDLSSAEVYDRRSNMWSTLPDMNEYRNGCGVASINGKIYVIGGSDHGKELASCEMFDPDTNVWTAIPDMEEAREGCAACAVGDKLYAIGGGNDNGWLSSVEVFDTITQEWSFLPSMKNGGCGCAAVSVGNKIYVFGGDDDYYECLSSAEVYDVTTQEWTKLPDMKEERYSVAATTVGNRIYVLGGNYYTNACEVFDTFSNSWSSPIPDIKVQRYGCAAIAVGPYIYVIGGDNKGTCTASVEMFEISMPFLYPTDDNYVTVEGGYRSPKLLENLCIDQFCRSLPDLDGDIPPGYPEYIVNTILESLANHGVLNATKMKVFRNYKLDQLPQTGIRGKRKQKLLSQFEPLLEKKCKQFKSNF